MNERAGPGLDRGDACAVAVVARQKDELDVGVHIAHPRAYLGSVAVGQPEVQEHDVRRLQLSQGHGFRDRAGAAHHDHVGLVVEKCRQPLIDDQMVFDDHDPNRNGALHLEVLVQAHDAPMRQRSDLYKIAHLIGKP